MKLIKNDIAILECDTHISKWVKESGRLDHDQNMLPFVLPFIKKGGIVIDAGAYIGDHTIAYSNAVGLDGFVFAFEPNEDAFDCLVYNLKNSPNTTCFNHGLGSEPCTKGIAKAKDNVGCTHITEGEGIVIDSIDNLNLFGVDFIKIDCEGYEVDILQGACATIEKFSPVLLIEINKSTLLREGKTENEIFKFLDKFGYFYRNIYEEQALEGDQYDIICTKNNINN